MTVRICAESDPDDKPHEPPAVRTRLQIRGDGLTPVSRFHALRWCLPELLAMSSRNTHASQVRLPD